MLTVTIERTKVFFDIQIGTRKEGRIFFELVCFITLQFNDPVIANVSRHSCMMVKRI